MKRTRNIFYGFTRIVCFFFAIHIFNLSIDPKDREPDYAPEDLSINDIESMAEFLAEIVFGFNNAFAEYDEPDENEGALDFCKDFYVGHSPFRYNFGIDSEVNREYFVQGSVNLIALTYEIHSPPPKG